GLVFRHVNLGRQTGNFNALVNGEFFCIGHKASLFKGSLLAAVSWHRGVLFLMRLVICGIKIFA
ncbi:hypothetical protein, partial [Candidatus Erwinia dacicola]|uniref:hypothetical protein n=1 Tax=Candidatus Erwinia dacicola TaxID=252393 RepID=UPI001C99EF67